MYKFRPDISRLLLLFLAALLSLPLAALAADEPVPLPLWPAGAPDTLIRHGQPESVENRENNRNAQGFNRIVSNVSTPTLTVYPAPGGQKAAPALVVFPGGGFRVLAWDKEGLDIARRFNAAGLTCIVVKYRLCPKQYETAEGRAPEAVRGAILADGPQAVRMVRANAAKWGIDPQRIGVIGFSAGGYMAAWTATHYTAGDQSAADPLAKVSSRPDFAALIYPAVPAGIDSVLSAETPPVFLVNADDDTTTPAAKAIALHNALVAAGVTTEMHIFTRGSHGFGLGVNGGAVTAWPGLLEGWLREREVIGGK